LNFHTKLSRVDHSSCNILGGPYFHCLYMTVHQKALGLGRYDLDLGDGLGKSKIASNLDLI
jgi:hypothetical protein